MYVQIRAGSDIAFLGGLIRIANRKQSASRTTYLVNYTNAAFIIKDGFKLPTMDCFPASTRRRRLTINPPGTIEEGGDLTGKPVAPIRVRNSSSATRSRRRTHGSPSRKARISGRESSGSQTGTLRSSAASEDCIRSFAGTSRCVFQFDEKQYETLHTGDVSASRAFPQDQFLKAAGPLTFRPQRRRHGKKCRPIIGGWTQAQLRHADIRTGGMLQCYGQRGTRGLAA